MDNKIKARLYGSENAAGPIKTFEIVDELPKAGELVGEIGNHTERWLEPVPAELDPEQRHSDQDKMWMYFFYICDIWDDEDNEFSSRKYYAVADPAAVDELEQDEDE